MMLMYYVLKYTIYIPHTHLFPLLLVAGCSGRHHRHALGAHLLGAGVAGEWRLLVLVVVDEVGEGALAEGALCGGRRGRRGRSRRCRRRTVQRAAAEAEEWLMFYSSNSIRHVTLKREC